METETNLPEDASATGIGLSESIGKVCTDKEQIEHQSETQSREKETIKHTYSEETMTVERSTKLSHDMEELEKIPESHSDENSNIKDVGNIMPEEAKDIKEAIDVELQKFEIESAHDDKATSTLPTKASVQVETVGKSIHEEIHEDTESAVKDSNKDQRPENNYEENTKVLQALDIHEATVNTCVENEKEAEPHYHVQKQETTDLKHLNLGLDTAKITPSDDTGEHEKVLASHTQEIEIMDGRNIIHEEAKKTEEETDIQIPKTAIESEPEDEATPILPKLVELDQGEMAEKSFEREKEEESTATDNGQSCRPGKELEQMFTALEEIDLPQTVGKFAAENEHTDHKSEAPGIENVITENSNSEGKLKMESSTKSSYDVEELEKISESHSVDNSETRYGGEAMPEKAIGIKEAAEVKLQNSETASVPADKALSTLHPTVSVGNQTVKESIQVDIHSEVEQAVTTTKEEQRSENDFEEEKNVLQACDLHEATRDSCVEIGKNDETKSEVQNLETIVVKHLELEGETIEVNMSNDTEGHERVPVSPAKEELDINEGRKWIQEEEKEIEEEIEDETLSTLPLPDNVQGEEIDDSSRKQNLKEEESAAMDKGNSSQPEYELEQTTNVFEEIDHSETMNYVSVQNEQNSIHKSEASTTEIVITKHINAGGMTTTESSKISIYDVDQQEMVPESHSANNTEIKDGSKITADEATSIKQATDMEIKKSIIESAPEDAAQSTLHTSASVKVDKDEESIEEEIQTKEAILEDDAQSKLLMLEFENSEMVKEILQQQTLQEEESEAIDNDKSYRPEKELEKLANVVEAVDQPKTIAKVSAENGEQEDHQSVASSVEIAIMNITNEEGNVTSASNSESCYDTKKLDKIIPSHSVEDSDMKNGSEIMPEEQTEIKESTDVELEKAETESVPEDKALTSLGNTASVTAETITQSIQEELYIEVQSTMVDTREEKVAQNNFETKEFPKEFSQYDTTSYTSTKNEQKAEPQFEVQNFETIITKHLNLEGETTEINLTNETEEHEEFLVSHTRERLKVEDDGKLTQEEAKAIEQATDMQILKTSTQSVTEDEAHSELPKLAIVKDETEESLQQQMLQEEESVVAHDNKSSSPENELDKMANMVETVDQPETIAKASEENENADHLSKASNMESVIKKEINAEGNKTPESSTKSSNDVDEKDQCKITQEEEEDIKRSADREFETESVLEDISQPTLPNTAFYGVEAAETCIQQELHKAELEVRDIVEEQIQEIDFEDKKKVPEVFGLHEVTQQTSEENEQKAEPQCKAQNQDATFTKHPNLEGQTTDIINRSSDADEQEKVPVSQTAEKLESGEDGKFKQEEANEKEDRTELQLLEPATESVTENEALETLPSRAFVSDQADEGSIEEEIQEEELAVINTTERQIPEIELEVKNNVHEAFGLHEVTYQTSDENEQKDEPQFEALNQENTSIKHLKSEGKTTDIINPTNDNEELDNVQEPHIGEKLEIKDDGNLIRREAKEMEEAIEMQSPKTASERVPEDKGNTEPAGVEEAEENIPGENHPEAELAVTNTKVGQKPEIDFMEEIEVLEAFGQHEVTQQTNAENELKLESQSQAHNEMTTFIKHPHMEGKTTDTINPTNDNEEQENLSESHTGGKLEIEDDGKSIQEEEKVMEEANEMQLVITTSESVPEDKGKETLPSPTSVGVEAVGTNIQEVPAEAELAVTNTKQGHIPELDFEKKKLPEEFVLHEVTLQDSVENVLNAEYHSAEKNQAITFIKHPNLEGKTTEINPTNGTGEQEHVSASQSREKLDIEDEGESIEEEAKEMEEATEMQSPKTATQSLTEDNSQSSLLNTPSVDVEADETSIQQETQMEVELAVPNSKERQIPENDFDEENKIPEAFGLHEVTHQTSVENELKAEHQSEEQNQETTFIKHSNLEGNTPDIIKPTNGIEEQEKVPVSHTGEKLESVKDGKSLEGEAEEIEEATEMKLPATARESLHEDEAKSTMLKLAFVKGEDEGILQQQILQGDTSAAIDCDKGYSLESELGKTADTVEATDNPQNMAKVSTENEEQADHQSESSSNKSMITRDINAEEKVTSESSTISSHDENRVEKIAESHSVEKSKINYGRKIISGEETDDKESSGELEDGVQPMLPNSSDSVGAVDRNIPEEIHTEGEFAVTNTEEEVTRQTSIENEQKAENQSEVQSHEITVIEHLDFEGETTEINPTNEIDDHEKIPALPTRQKLDITDDDGKFIPEEPTKMQLLKTATESVSEDENQSTLPKSTIVNVEKVEEFFQEQTLTEEESAAIHDNNSSQPENELEQTVVVEEMDHPETMAKISTENEEHEEHQSEQSSIKNVSTEHNSSEEIVTKSSHDVEEIEKVPESDIVDKSETKNDGKIMLEDATDVREATDVELQKPEIESVPEDQAISPLSTIPSVGVEVVREYIQEETEKVADSALIDVEEGQRPSNTSVESTRVLEAFDTSLENEKKAKPHSNAQIMDTTVIKHSDIGGLETAETSPILDIEEIEKISVSHTREKLEIKQGEAKEKEEEATEMQSLKTATESAHDDEHLSILPTSETVKGEMVEQSIQEQPFKEKESTAIDDNKSSKPENDHRQTTIAFEANVRPDTTDKVSAEKDENADDNSEATKMENATTKQINSEGMAATESCRKTSYAEDEWEIIPESYLVNNSEIKDAGEIHPKEEMNIKATAVELQKSETESMPEDKVFSTLSTIEPVRDDTFQKSIQEEIHKEAESAVTDTGEERRPESELEEDKKDLEAFDLHEGTGYTYVESEKNAETQSLEAMVINDPNLEGMETAETRPINDTKVLDKEQKVVIPVGVSELLSVYITEECSNEDIPELKHQSMLSDQNTTNVTSARGCTATSTEKKSEATEGQENSETTFVDSLTGVAIERVTTELETGDLSHEQETTDDTPAEKIVKAADTNKDLKLAPDSIAKDQSDKNNSCDTIYKADVTSTDDEKGEKVRNNFESDITEKVAENLDPDGQSDMHESTKKEKRELPAEKIPEPPYPCKKLESLFDSEADTQTNEKLYQTKEKSNNILDQISKSDGHIQGKQFQSENQIKPEPQLEGEHHSSKPLYANPISMASIKSDSEVHDGVDSAEGSENIEKQTIDSGKNLFQVQISFPREETVEQVKDHDINNFKATDSNEPRVITDLSIGNDDPIQEEATSRDSIETTEQEATTKMETQEEEITQEGNAKEEGGGDELKNGVIKSSRDTDTKASPKKSHGILSGVGSKVKHSISKVKKAITGKSSHPKAPSTK